MVFRKLWCLPCLLILALTGCHSWHRGALPPLRTAKGYGFSFQYSAATFKSYKVTQEARWTEQDNGDEVPSPTAPAHTKFTLQQEIPAYAREKGRDPFTESEIVVLPLHDTSVPDLAAAYKYFLQDASDLRKILKDGVRPVALGSTLPEWELEDAEQTIHSKIQIVDTPWCSGIQYLTQDVQENCPISNEELGYQFEGLSRDGTYYISISVPVANPILSEQGPDVDNYTKEQMNAYLLDMEKRLNQAKDESFSPSLVELRALVQSMRPVK